MHTNTAGAMQVAQEFISGLKCPAAQGALAEYISLVGESIDVSC